MPKEIEVFSIFPKEKLFLKENKNFEDQGPML